MTTHQPEETTMSGTIARRGLDAAVAHYETALDAITDAIAALDPADTRSVQDACRIERDLVRALNTLRDTRTHLTRTEKDAA